MSECHIPQEPPDWVLEKIRKQFRYRPNSERNAVRRDSRLGVGYGTIGNNGYVRFSVGRRKEQYSVLAHHIAFYLYRHRYKWPTQSMDHVNGDKLDNRISNLRFASISQNNANSNVKRTNTSGYPGVIWRKASGKWQVQIKKNYKGRYFGIFVNYDEAVAVARRARKRMFGRFDPGI